MAASHSAASLLLSLARTFAATLQMLAATIIVPELSRECLQQYPTCLARLCTSALELENPAPRRGGMIMQGAFRQDHRSRCFRNGRNRRSGLRSRHRYRSRRWRDLGLRRRRRQRLPSVGYRKPVRAYRNGPLTRTLTAGGLRRVVTKKLSELWNRNDDSYVWF